jgi:DNA repair protein RadC
LGQILAADLTATKAIKTALVTLNMKLLDHIIVNDIGYISFAEQGLL